MLVRILGGKYKGEIFEATPIIESNYVIVNLEGIPITLLENEYEVYKEPELTNKEFVEELLMIYKLNCISLMLTADDTDVENEINEKLENIKQDILNLIN